ncbi:MAG: hypothetical protein IJ124_08755 [Clostridia bacterium]|nr:hypothetical protein [Clostridia bacterium]
MLKLMKYEFFKWRTTLLALLVGLVALEIGFIAGEKLNKTGLMSVCLGLISMLAFAAFVYLLIAGIAGYSQELREKSGYLVFMTPVRTMGVVLSKLLFIALTALVAMALFGGAAYLDFKHLIGRLNLDARALEQVNMLLRFGLNANATVQQIVQTAIFLGCTVLIEVMLTLCTGYLAVTLSATLMQNKKGLWRGLVSLVIFVALTWGSSWITQKLLYDRVNIVNANADILRDLLLWASLLNFAFCAAFTFASAWLLKHKVNL